MKPKFPSPTGVNHYEYDDFIMIVGEGKKEFPSPTGVNHYESEIQNFSNRKVPRVSVPYRG